MKLMTTEFWAEVDGRLPVYAAAAWLAQKGPVYVVDEDDMTIEIIERRGATVVMRPPSATEKETRRSFIFRVPGA